MLHISDWIVYFWMLPVVLQIFLPLTMFAVWQVSRLFKLRIATSEKSTEGMPTLNQNSA